MQDPEEAAAQGSLVVEPTQFEEEPTIEQQTAERASILSRDKMGSANQERSMPQSKGASAAPEEETKVVATPAKEDAAEPNKNEG